MKYPLKFVTVLFFLCVNCFVLKAQQKHFIYVQSEDKQPFAVVLGGKVFSSSDYGYVIIPKLADSTYKFTVSFPLNKFPDQYFSCTINKKDAGYLLKNQSEGWALQNMQTQKLIMNSTAAATSATAFGDMLSDVVNDSTLTKNTVQKPADTIKTIADNAAGDNSTVAAATVAGTAGIVAATTGNSTAGFFQPEKLSEEKLDTGTNMMFVDKTENGIDTINVFVPGESSANAGNATEDNQQALPENTTTSQPVIPVPINNDSIAQNNSSSIAATEEANNTVADTSTHAVSNPFYKPEQNATNTAVIVGATTLNQPAAPGVSNATKQDCDNTLSDEEMNKLKRKMFAQKNDNDMIQYVVKYLNKKCITTGQVKELGNLFSSDDGRYSLYDALYVYTYDYGNYPILASQILDPYYKKRFAALLR